MVGPSGIKLQLNQPAYSAHTQSLQALNPKLPSSVLDLCWPAQQKKKKKKNSNKKHHEPYQFNRIDIPMRGAIVYDMIVFFS